MTDHSGAVVVLSGGLSHERDVSLRSGRRVAQALRSRGTEVIESDVDSDLLPQLTALGECVVFPVLHGEAGEDGALREVLALLGVTLIGMGCAVLVPSTNALIGRAVRPEERPLAISRAWMLGFSGYFVGPVLLGWIAEGVGLRAAFVAIGLLLVLILPGLSRLGR